MHSQTISSYMNRAKKVVSWIVAFCFVTSQLGVAAPSLPVSASGVELKRHEPVLAIPSEIGTIIDRSSEGRQLIVHIQDAHANYEAQQNIKKILETLHRDYGFKLIALEGAVSPLKKSLYRLFPFQNVNRAIADTLARRGEISGAELFYFEAPKETVVEGADSREEYQASVKLFREIMKEWEGENLSLYKRLRAKLELLKSHIFSPELKAFDSKMEAFTGGKIALSDYLAELSREAKKILSLNLADPKEQLRFPNAVRLMRLKAIEPGLRGREKEIEKEIESFHRYLEKNIPRGEAGREAILKGLKSLLLNGKEKSDQDQPSRRVFERLYEIALQRGFSFEPFEKVKRLVEYKVLSSEVDSKHLFAEVKILQDEIIGHLAKTGDEKTLVEISRRAGWLDSLLRLEASRDDFKALLANEEGFLPSKLAQGLSILESHRRGKVKPSPQALEEINRLDQHLKRAEEFYQLSLKRDHAFVEKTLALMKREGVDRAVLVAGGFHTEGVRELFKEENTSCVVVSPKISEVSPSATYLDAMMNRLGVFKSSEASNKLALAVRSVEGSALENLDPLAYKQRGQAALEAVVAHTPDLYREVALAHPEMKTRTDQLLQQSNAYLVEAAAGELLKPTNTSVTLLSAPANGVGSFHVGVQSTGISSATGTYQVTADGHVFKATLQKADSQWPVASVAYGEKQTATSVGSDKPLVVSDAPVGASLGRDSIEDLKTPGDWENYLRSIGYEFGKMADHDVAIGEVEAESPEWELKGHALFDFTKKRQPLERPIPGLQFKPLGEIPYFNPENYKDGKDYQQALDLLYGTPQLRENFSMLSGGKSLDTVPWCGGFCSDIAYGLFNEFQKRPDVQMVAHIRSRQDTQSALIVKFVNNPEIYVFDRIIATNAAIPDEFLLGWYAPLYFNYNGKTNLDRLKANQKNRFKDYLRFYNAYFPTNFVIDQDRVYVREEISRDAAASLGKGEISEARMLAEKLRTPLNAQGDEALGSRFLQGGYRQEGYGVPDGAAIDGSHAFDGTQGYYVAGEQDHEVGGQAFLEMVRRMQGFFGQSKHIYKIGIGGEYTPFEGIADAFRVIDGGNGIIKGESELGINYEAALAQTLKQQGADWNQIAVILSSKSGATDETMMIFTDVFHAILKHITGKEGLDGQRFADLVFETMHEVNFMDGKERDQKDLFRIDPERFNTSSLITLVYRNAKEAKLKIAGKLITRAKVKAILGKVLGNMFFETTDRPAISRLSAFMRNSRLDHELGEKAPVMGAMFDNVGGRWTGDLHMMTFLAYYHLDAEQYWQIRHEGIQKVREGKHQGNRIGNKIVDEGITDIALVVPDYLYWFGKSIEQNFNESVWQEGFANLVAVKQSEWETQKRHYQDQKRRLVINLSDSKIPTDQFNSVRLRVPDFKKLSKQQLANQFAELFTTFYGMTNTVGTRLIVKALHEAGYQVKDVDLNHLDHPATKIVQRNLFLRQPYVELGKDLLRKRLEILQEHQGKSSDAISKAYEAIQRAAQRKALRTNIDEPGVQFPTKIERVEDFVQVFRQAVDFANKTGRKLVPFIYLEGDKFSQLRSELISMGVEWVLQGTGDQHISYQQVLAQPKKYLPFLISFLPEEPLPSHPAIGFAKSYLDRISPSMVRDSFAEASYEALTALRQDQGGKALFLRLKDTPEDRDLVKQAAEQTFKPASRASSLGRRDGDAAGDFMKLLNQSLATKGQGVEVKLLDDEKWTIEINPYFVEQEREKILEGIQRLKRAMEDRNIKWSSNRENLSYIRMSGVPEFHLEQRDTLILIAVGKVLGFWDVFPDPQENIVKAREIYQIAVAYHRTNKENLFPQIININLEGTELSAASLGKENFGLRSDEFLGLNYLLKGEIPEKRDEEAKRDVIGKLETLYEFGSLDSAERNLAGWLLSVLKGESSEASEGKKVFDDIRKASLEFLIRQTMNAMVEGEVRTVVEEVLALFLDGDYRKAFDRIQEMRTSGDFKRATTFGGLFNPSSAIPIRDIVRHLEQIVLQLRKLIPVEYTLTPGKKDTDYRMSQMILPVGPSGRTVAFSPEGDIFLADGYSQRFLAAEDTTQVRWSRGYKYGYDAVIDRNRNIVVNNMEGPIDILDSSDGALLKTIDRYRGERRTRMMADANGDVLIAEKDYDMGAIIRKLSVEDYTYQEPDLYGFELVADFAIGNEGEVYILNVEDPHRSGEDYFTKPPYAPGIYVMKKWDEVSRLRFSATIFSFGDPTSMAVDKEGNFHVAYGEWKQTPMVRVFTGEGEIIAEIHQLAKYGHSPWITRNLDGDIVISLSNQERLERDLYLVELMDKDGERKFPSVPLLPKVRDEKEIIAKSYQHVNGLYEEVFDWIFEMQFRFGRRELKSLVGRSDAEIERHHKEHYPFNGVPSENSPIIQALVDATHFYLSNDDPPDEQAESLKKELQIVLRPEIFEAIIFYILNNEFMKVGETFTAEELAEKLGITPDLVYFMLLPYMDNHTGLARKGIVEVVGNPPTATMVIGGSHPSPKQIYFQKMSGRYFGSWKGSARPSLQELIQHLNSVEASQTNPQAQSLGTSDGASLVERYKDQGISDRLEVVARGAPRLYSRGTLHASAEPRRSIIPPTAGRDTSRIHPHLHRRGFLRRRGKSNASSLGRSTEMQSSEATAGVKGVGAYLNTVPHKLRSQFLSQEGEWREGGSSAFFFHLFVLAGKMIIAAANIPIATAAQVIFITESYFKNIPLASAVGTISFHVSNSVRAITSLLSSVKKFFMSRSIFREGLLNYFFTIVNNILTKINNQTTSANRLAVSGKWIAHPSASSLGVDLSGVERGKKYGIPFNGRQVELVIPKGMNPEAVVHLRGVVFDIDGVLAESGSRGWYGDNLVQVGRIFKEPLPQSESPRVVLITGSTYNFPGSNSDLKERFVNPMVSYIKGLGVGSRLRDNLIVRAASGRWRIGFDENGNPLEPEDKNHALRDQDALEIAQRFAVTYLSDLDLKTLRDRNLLAAHNAVMRNIIRAPSVDEVSRLLAEAVKRIYQHSDVQLKHLGADIELTEHTESHPDFKALIESSSRILASRLQDGDIRFYAGDHYAKASRLDKADVAREEMALWPQGQGAVIKLGDSAVDISFLEEEGNEGNPHFSFWLSRILESPPHTLTVIKAFAGQIYRDNVGAEGTSPILQSFLDAALNQKTYADLQYLDGGRLSLRDIEQQTGKTISQLVKEASRASSGLGGENIVGTLIPGEIRASDGERFTVGYNSHPTNDPQARKLTLSHQGKVIAYADFLIGSPEESSIMTNPQNGVAIRVEEPYGGPQGNYQGIGTSLMSMAFRISQAAGSPKFLVWKSTPDSSPFFSKIGMILQGEDDFWFPLDEKTMSEQGLSFPPIAINRRSQGAGASLGKAKFVPANRIVPPYDFEKTMQIEREERDKEIRARRHLDEVFKNFDYEKEHENIRKLRAEFTESGKYITVSRHGRASYFLVLLAAASGFLTSLDRIRDITQKLETVLKNTSSTDLRNQVMRLQGPVEDLARLIGEEHVSVADVEGRRKKILEAVNDFQKRAQTEIDLVMEATFERINEERGEDGSQASTTLERLFQLSDQVDEITKHMKQELAELKVFLARTPKEEANFSVLLQRASETGVRNIVRINAGLDPFEADEEHIAKAIADAGENVYASSDSAWLEKADYWIEALPLFTHGSEGKLPDGRTETEIIIEQQAFEAALRQLAPYWVRNIGHVTATENIALARKLLVENDASLKARVEVLKTQNPSWKEEEAVRAAVKERMAEPPVARSYDLEKAIVQLAVLIDQTSRNLAWDVAKFMETQKILRYEALDQILVTDALRGNLYARAKERSIEKKISLPQAVGEILEEHDQSVEIAARKLAATADQYLREKLAGQKRRELPTWIILTTQAAGMSGMFTSFWLEEEMGLYALTSDTYHEGRTLEEEAQTLVREYESRIVELGGKVIQEFSLEGLIPLEIANQGLPTGTPQERTRSERRAILTLLSKYPAVRDEVAKLAVLWEMSGVRDKNYSDEPPAVLQASASNDERYNQEATARVIRENTELSQLSSDEAEAEVERNAAYRNERDKYIRVFARQDVIENHPDKDFLSWMVKNYLRLHLAGGTNIGLSTARKEVISHYYRHQDGRLERVDDWDEFWKLHEKDEVEGEPLWNLLNHPLYAYEASGGFKKYNKGYGPSRVDLGFYERFTVQQLSQWLGPFDRFAKMAMMKFYRLYNYDVRAFDDIRVAEEAKPGENDSMESALYQAHRMMSFHRAIGIGNYYHLAYEWNQRMEVFMRAGGGTSDGFCQPKDIYFDPLVVGIAQDKSLEYAGVPVNKHQGVKKLVRHLMLERRRFKSEVEWREWVMTELAEDETVTKYFGARRITLENGQESFFFDAKRFLPPLARLAEGLSKIGIRDPVLDIHGFINALAADYHGRGQGDAEAGMRFAAVELVHMIQQALDEAHERSGGRTPRYKDAVIALPVEYKPVPDVRLSIGLRLFEFMAGTGEHLMEPFTSEAKAITRFILNGYDRNDEVFDSILRRVFRVAEIDEDTKRELESLRPQGEHPADIRIYSPFRMTPTSIYDYIQGNQLKETATRVRSIIKEYGLTDDAEIDANVITHGTKLEKYTKLKDLSPKKLQELKDKVSGILLTLVFQVRLDNRDWSEGPGSDIWQAIRGVDVIVLAVHYLEMVGNEDAGKENRDLLIAHHPEEAEKERAREAAIMIRNLGRVRDESLQDNPDGALAFGDIPTQGRKNASDVLGIKQWQALNLTGKPILEQPVEVLGEGRAPVYFSPAVPSEDVRRYEGEMRTDRKNAFSLYQALLSGDYETAGKIYREKIGSVIPDRVEQARKEEELAKAAADWWRGGGFMNWSERHRYISNGYHRVAMGLDLADLDWGTFLILGGMFLLNGEPEEEIAKARREFEAAIQLFRQHEQGRQDNEPQRLESAKPFDPKEVQVIQELYVTPKYVPPIEDLKQIPGVRTSLKRREGSEESAAGRALELFRLRQKALAMQDRSGGFQAVMAEAGPANFDRFYHRAKLILGDGEGDMSYHDYGRFLGFAKRALSALVDEIIPDRGASDKDQMEKKSIARRLETVFGMGSEVTFENWEAVAGFREDIGDFGRLGKRLNGDKDKLKRLMKGVELFITVLALEMTLEYRHISQEEMTKIGEERVSSQLMQVIASFFATTLYDHYFDYLPKIIAPSESGTYMTDYNFILGENYDPSSDQMLGAGKPFTRDEMLEISKDIFSWVNAYFEHLMTTKTRLKEFDDSAKQALLGSEDTQPIGSVGEEDTKPAKEWWRITQQRELAYLDHDGHDVIGVFDQCPNCAEVIGAHRIVDGKLVLGSRANIAIVAPAGRTHITTFEEENAIYNEEHPDRKANWIITREADFMDVDAPQADGSSRKERVMVVRSGFQYLSREEYILMRVEQLKSQGIDEVQAQKTALMEADNALKKNPKGVLSAIRFDKPILISVSFPFHGAPYYLRGDDEKIGLPTSQSWIHNLLFYRKTEHTKIHDEASGVVIPPELQWYRVFQYDEQGNPRPVPDVERELLEGREGFAGLLDFMMRHWKVIAKAETQSGGRQSFAEQVVDAAGKPMETKVRELLEHLVRVGWMDSSVIQKLIPSSPQTWASRDYLNLLVDGLIVKGQAVPWWAKMFVYSRIVAVSSGRPEDRTQDEYDYVLELLVSSLMAISNVGLGGVLKKSRPEFYRTEQIADTLRKKREETAYLSMRAIEKRAETLALEIEGKAGRKLDGIDRTGTPYVYPRYIMHDILDIPVITVNGKVIQFPEVVDHKFDSAGNLKKIIVLNEKHEPVEGEIRWLRVEIDPEAIEDWMTILIENNIGYGLWAPFKYDERAEEIARAKKAGETPNPHNWGKDLRTIMYHFVNAAYDYTKALAPDVKWQTPPSGQSFELIPATPAPPSSPASQEPTIQLSKMDDLSRVARDLALEHILATRKADLQSLREQVGGNPALIQEIRNEARGYLHGIEEKLGQALQTHLSRDEDARSFISDAFLERVAELVAEKVFTPSSAPDIAVTTKAQKTSDVLNRLEGHKNHVIVFDDPIGMGGEVYSMMVSAFSERDDSGKPHFNVVAARPEWIIREGDHRGKVSKILYWNTETNELIETELTEPISVRQIQYKGSTQREALSELYQDLEIPQVNPFGKETAATLATDKFAVTEKLKGKVHVPEAYSIARNVPSRVVLEVLLQFLSSLLQSGGLDHVSFRVQANHGTEGEDNFLWTLTRHEVDHLDSNSPLVKQVMTVLEKDDVLIRKEVGNVRYGDEGQRLTFRINVATDGVRTVAESGYVQVGAPGAAVSSVSQKGEILSVAEAVANLRVQKDERLTPYILTEENFGLLKKETEQALEALNEGLPPNQFLRFAGIDVEVEATNKETRFYILDINPEPEGMVHSSAVAHLYKEDVPVTGEPIPTRHLFQPSFMRAASLGGQFEAFAGKSFDEVEFVSIGAGRAIRAILGHYFLEELGWKAVVAQTKFADVSEMLAKRGNGTYEIDTIDRSGRRETKEIEGVVAAGSLDEEHRGDRSAFMNLAPQLKNLKVIGFGVTEQGIQAKSQAIQDLTEFLYRLYLVNPVRTVWVLNTDNVRDNGRHIKEYVLQSDLTQSKDKNFRTWLDKNVFIPRTQVDRITDYRRQHVRDGATIEEDRTVPETEALPNKTLVIEALKSQIPTLPAWLEALAKQKGVLIRRKKGEIDKDYAMKLQIENAVHTALAYVAALTGYRTSGETVHDPVVREYLIRLFEREIKPALMEEYKLRENELQDYFEEWMTRIDRVHDVLFIAQNAAVKINERFGPTIAALKHFLNREPGTEMAFAIAVILAYLTYFPQEDEVSGLVQGLIGKAKATVEPKIREALQKVAGNLTVYPRLTERIVEYYFRMIGLRERPMEVLRNILLVDDMLEDTVSYRDSGYESELKAIPVDKIYSPESLVDEVNQMRKGEFRRLRSWGMGNKFWNESDSTALLLYLKANYKIRIEGGFTAEKIDNLLRVAARWFRGQQGDQPRFFVLKDKGSVQVGIRGYERNEVSFEIAKVRSLTDLVDQIAKSLEKLTEGTNRQVVIPRKPNAGTYDEMFRENPKIDLIDFLVDAVVGRIIKGDLFDTGDGIAADLGLERISDPKAMEFVRHVIEHPVKADEVKDLDETKMSRVIETLRHAQESGEPFKIRLPLRGFVVGSGLDFKSLIQELTPSEARSLSDFLATITLAAPYWVELEFTPAQNSNAIEYDATAIPYLGRKIHVVEGPVRMKGGKTPHAHRDAAAYILRNLFGLRGIHVKFTTNAPAAVAGGGLESNVFIQGLFQAAARFTGMPLSPGDIYAAAVEVENLRFGGQTGGHGIVGAYGGARDNIWLAGLKGEHTVRPNEYGVFSVQRFERSALDFLSKRMALFQPGIPFKGQGQIQGSGRLGGFSSYLGMGLIRIKDSVAMSYYLRRMALVEDFRLALARKDIQGVIDVLNTDTKVRDLIPLRGIELLKLAMSPQADKDSIEFRTLLESMDKKKFDDLASLLKEEDALENKSIYLGDKEILDLIERVRTKGGAYLPLGAGGFGVNAILVFPTPDALQNFLHEEGYEQLVEENAKQIMEDGGLLKGWVPLSVEEKGLEFIGPWDSSFKPLPGLRSMFYDQRMGTFEDTGRSMGLPQERNQVEADKAKSVPAVQTIEEASSLGSLLAREGRSEEAVVGLLRDFFSLHIDPAENIPVAKGLYDYLFSNVQNADLSQFLKSHDSYIDSMRGKEKAEAIYKAAYTSGSELAIVVTTPENFSVEAVERQLRLNKGAVVVVVGADQTFVQDVKSKLGSWEDRIFIEPFSNRENEAVLMKALLSGKSQLGKELYSRAKTLYSGTEKFSRSVFLAHTSVLVKETVAQFLDPLIQGITVAVPDDEATIRESLVQTYGNQWKEPLNRSLVTISYFLARKGRFELLDREMKELVSRMVVPQGGKNYLTLILPGLNQWLGELEVRFQGFNALAQAA